MIENTVVYLVENYWYDDHRTNTLAVYADKSVAMSSCEARARDCARHHTGDSDYEWSAWPIQNGWIVESVLDNVAAESFTVRTMVVQ